MRETQNQTKKNWSAQKASKLRFISRNCVKVRWVWCAARSVIWNLLSGAFFCRGQWDYLLWLYLPTWGVRSRASLGFKLQLCSIVGCGGTTKSSRNRCVLVCIFSRAHRMWWQYRELLRQIDSSFLWTDAPAKTPASIRASKRVHGTKTTRQWWIDCCTRPPRSKTTYEWGKNSTEIDRSLHT